MSSYKKIEENVKYSSKSISDIVNTSSKQSSLDAIIPQSINYQIKGSPSNYSSSNSYSSYSSKESAPTYTSPNTGMSVKSVFN